MKKSQKRRSLVRKLDEIARNCYRWFKKHPVYSLWIGGLVIIIINLNTFVDSVQGLWNKIDLRFENIGKDEIYEEYLKKSEIAYDVFLEVKGNLKKIDLLIEAKDNSLKQVFSYSQYNHYHPKFGLKELDKQISHFYENIQNEGMNYSIDELNILRDIGNFIVKEMENYFCCEEKENFEEEPKLVSGPTVKVDGKGCYLKYRTAARESSTAK